MRWLDSIKEATGLRLDALKEAVQGSRNYITITNRTAPNTGSCVSFTSYNLFGP